MDAFADRGNLPRGGLTKRFVLAGVANQEAILDELDDMRNVFAHNFAGVADSQYPKHSKRLRLKANQPYSPSGGHQFQRCVSR